MSIVNNEQLKLTANWLNTLGVAFVVTGTIAPIIAMLYGVGSAPSRITWDVPIIAASCFLCGIGLHLRARQILRGLK